MRDPAVDALMKVKDWMQSHATNCMEHPASDPFNHGKQVGEYVGLQKAAAMIENALSASDDAEAKL